MPDGHGSSFTYACDRAAREVNDILAATPRPQHGARLRELAGSFFIGVPELLAAELIGTARTENGFV